MPVPRVGHEPVVRFPPSFLKVVHKAERFFIARDNRPRTPLRFPYVKNSGYAVHNTRAVGGVLRRRLFDEEMAGLMRYSRLGIQSLAKCTGRTWGEHTTGG